MTVKQAIKNAVDLASKVAVNREPTQDIVVTDDIKLRETLILQHLVQ